MTPLVILAAGVAGLVIVALIIGCFVLGAVATAGAGRAASPRSDPGWSIR